MEIIIIVARSTQGVIGRDNELPWRLPADLKHFKATTLGYPIIMGRNTWESLGRALPERRNIVISRTKGFTTEDAETFSSLEDALDACESSEKVFIIGGAQIYESAIEFADKMIITEVALDVVGDAHFPEFDEEEWAITHLEEHAIEPDPKNPGQFFPAYTFVTYERK
jgi:dihydrofolate reductase